MSEPTLYNPEYEHDSCGVGLIVHLDKEASRFVVETALSALTRMTHRGAVAADGVTGDGCGLLLDMPEAFMRRVARDHGHDLGPRFAVGMVFLPSEAAAAERFRAALVQACGELALRVLFWRPVPLRPYVLGEAARAALPTIEQAFVAPAQALDRNDFARALYLARRRVEQTQLDGYIASLATHSVVYKGMVTPERLAAFYPDLSCPDFCSAVAIFHQRFSTNTKPEWRLAHPFRMLAHNGEINTIQGNRRWAEARASKWRGNGIDFGQFGPLVRQHGSDSESLDNLIETLIAGGKDLLEAVRIALPPATSTLGNEQPEVRAYFDFHALHLEAWDGPAAVLMYDGRYAGCALDRNGLRPARWWLTRNRLLTVASEAGVWEPATAEISAKGRLGPGQILAVDLYTGELLDTAKIDARNARLAPYGRWLRQGLRYLDSTLVDPSLAAEPMPPDVLARFQRRFGLSREERDQILKTLGESENEAVGSMGDDTPLAVLSQQPRSLYDFFRQAFAQVTNPPIDSLRERVVMSLTTHIGREGNIFDLGPEDARMVEMISPVLAQRTLRQLLAMSEHGITHLRIDLNYGLTETLPQALDRMCAAALAAVRDGRMVLVLSDRYPQPEQRMVHALLATAAIHRALVSARLRADCNLIVETATARDPHHFACLIGYGATQVYPYLAYQTLNDLARRGVIKAHQHEPFELGRAYRRAVRKGLLKILSKMGIASIDSYRGAQLFEIVGLDDEVVTRAFGGTPCRVGGCDFARIEAHDEAARLAANDDAAALAVGGLLRWVGHGGEYHAYNPDVVVALQRAVMTADWADYERYRDLVDQRPPTALRDLLELVAGDPVPLAEVEAVTSIVKRFDSAAMSLGALSPEAHEALAIAMNRLGGRSNSGEGGEDPARYGSEKNSRIKQVASGRFGVTPAYLVNADVLQIKIAQGAKPGEGGQLPGHKVNELIARLRYARPGIGLISPPPHHDIYSIEDLAQLIFDLKQVNPRALVSVKLVSHAGVGTIAAGVIKAYADLVTIAGHDGGTGASPQSSIKYAGAPWELGLAETQQTLVRHGLRGRARIQIDGGLKTGLDVIKATLLGAESFGFGTGPMIALGCKYLRICHLNTCATGVATQDEHLRKHHFKGLPERVISYFELIAEDVRRHLAALGYRRLEDLIGRVELLRPRAPADGLPAIDLRPLLAGQALADAPRSCANPHNPPHDQGLLASQISAACSAAIAQRQSAVFQFKVCNSDRSIGARLSGEIARLYGDEGLADAELTLKLSGTAGQSFGVFNARGLVLELTGEANDYVGKGMAGGRIVLRPATDISYPARLAPIMGNTCLYGATGGELYAAGIAGERFAVRNSGAVAVIEGIGDHGCEYMTGGVVVVIGATGINFGAGMTGGFAYVLDSDRNFVDRYNHELVDISRIVTETMQNHVQHLRDLLAKHVLHTGSAYASELLDDFRAALPRFWLVKPKAAAIGTLIDTLKRAA